MLNPATRFLRAELERIRLELHRMELGSTHSLTNDDLVSIYDEYRRRYEIMCEIVPHATTDEAAVSAVEQKLNDVVMLLDELVAAERGDVDDYLAVALEIDAQYLEGLLIRLQKGIESETFTRYALANVDRL